MADGILKYDPDEIWNYYISLNKNREYIEDAIKDIERAFNSQQDRITQKRSYVMDKQTEWKRERNFLMDKRSQAKDEKEQGGANKFDAQSMRLTIMPKLPIEGITERVYTCQLTLSVVKGKLGFLIEKAKCVPNNVLGAIAAINLDKINLAKKPQNKQYIDEFAIVCQSFINDMLSEILNREVNLNNWEAIKKGQVVKGMDQSEVKMAIGKPSDITENTQRVMWTYASGKIVVFENGIVTGMLN